ncbi:MAG: SRPBCC family protein [Proteobacteria bacterium]|nr:SRPBCC family protein [Pseudomonadota bacterium]
MVAEFSNSTQAERGGPATFGPAHVYDEFDDQSQSLTPRIASQAARNLGLLSLVLGAGALFMPGLLSRIGGLEQRRRLLPLVGMRELAAGVGLLSADNPRPWLWSRVVGDGMDLVVLASCLLSPRNPRRLNAAVATAVVAAITAIDVRESLRSSDEKAPSAAPDALVTASVIVGKSTQECYDFWRDPTNMTRISPIVESVTVVDNRTSRWCIRSPLGTRIEWDSKVTGDTPGERISWRSVDGGGLYHAGVIRFEEAVGGRGTLVTTSMHYRVPGGSAGVALAKLIGADPRKEVREDLRRFKQLLEAGEIPTTEGQPNGRRSLLGSLL